MHETALQWVEGDANRAADAKAVLVIVGDKWAPRRLEAGTFLRTAEVIAEKVFEAKGFRGANINSKHNEKRDLEGDSEADAAVGASGTRIFLQWQLTRP